jgi:hypothetical protein
VLNNKDPTRNLIPFLYKIIGLKHQVSLRLESKLSASPYSTAAYIIQKRDTVLLLISANILPHFNIVTNVSLKHHSISCERQKITTLAITRWFYSSENGLL